MRESEVTVLFQMSRITPEDEENVDDTLFELGVNLGDRVSVRHGIHIVDTAGSFPESGVAWAYVVNERHNGGQGR